jgi:hypothetical protein
MGKKQNITKVKAVELPTIDEEIRHEKEQEGSIIRTWGTGTGKRTMSLHIRKSYYTNLGWDIGDFLYMEPNFDKGEIVIKKVDTDKLKRKR